MSFWCLVIFVVGLHQLLLELFGTFVILWYYRKSALGIKENAVLKRMEHFKVSQIRNDTKLYCGRLRRNPAGKEQALLNRTRSYSQRMTMNWI